MPPSRARARVAAICIVLAIALSGCTPFWAQSTPTPLPSGTPTLAPIVTNGNNAGCPAWTTPPSTPPAAPPSGASAQAIAAYNAALVLQTPRPTRNLYDVIQHLVRHVSQSIGCRVRSAPRDEAVGHVQTFYVVNPSQTGYHQVQATLIYETPHVYMYLENGASASHDALKASADAFEQHIFATDTSTYGQPWTPGPDDDPHVTVLNAGNLGPIGGYFSSEDEFPQSVSPYSNERQMIYINLDGGEVPGTADYDSTLAHEFQHMIHWYWHPADPSWYNEGSSMLAQHINGYNAGGVDQVFLAQPDTMLGGWTDDEQADVAHYGAGYLFMDYFAEHYGGTAVLRELLTDPNQVPLNFDHVLQAHGYSDRFNDVFAKFVMANLLNDPSIANGIYAYPTIPGEHAQPQQTITTYPYTAGSASAPQQVHQYAATYDDFQPSGGAGAQTLSINFHGSPTTRIIANQPYSGASAEWWSNSANDADTTLTRAFDLSALAGKQATLNFQAWYDLETDFDYTYVAVSTDNGQNWTPLATNTSSATNPNGANYGHGMTGISGGNPNQTCGPTPQWIPESANLSAYAGEKVLLRFETITDDAVHCPGFALDAISIPQLGFSDSVSSDNGWQARGWVRSNNVLPEQYVLQAAVYLAGQADPQVVRIPVDASGAATQSFSGFGGQITHVTLAITAMAPATIVPAQYQLTAQVG